MPPLKSCEGFRPSSRFLPLFDVLYYQPCYESEYAADDHAEHQAGALDVPLPAEIY